MSSTTNNLESENVVQQLTIDQIINKGVTFEIPDYQRGYRWSEREVTDLLDDIMSIAELDKNVTEVQRICDNQPYCLQPIAFDTSKKEQKVMIVVDGQQRLTTLFLILKYFKKEIIDRVPAQNFRWMNVQDITIFDRCFKIQYQNSDRNFVFARLLDNLDSEDDDDIDAYYITQAYKYIKEWGRINFNDNVLVMATFAIKVFYGTSVIWYEINPDTDGTTNDYFAKINTGRIPLTNSELIKANLMLDEYCVGKIDKDNNDSQTQKMLRENLNNERIKISRQWDTIENNLRNDEFWYFLTQKSDKYEDTRIDFIFEIVAEKLCENDADYNNIMSLNKERGSFIIIERYLKKHKDDVGIGSEVWKMAWDTYMTFREWFDDRQLYHYIGYLISIGSKNAKELIKTCSEKKLEDDSKKKFKTKYEIRQELKYEIKKQAFLYSDDRHTRERNLDGYKDFLSGLYYEENNKRKKEELIHILLLFNVISIVSDCRSEEDFSRDTYFPFSRFKKEEWNLEHIHSKADADFSSKKAADEYMDYLAKISEQMREKLGKNGQKIKDADYIAISDAVKGYAKEIERQMRQGVDAESAAIASAKIAVSSIGNKFNDLTPVKMDGIGNLTLLDASTNKSYKNAPFFMKRMIIRDIVSGKDTNVSRFIPFCTRNVFDKSYTKYPNNMLHWTDDDYEEYFNTIAETIWNYLNKNSQEENGR